MTKRLAFTLSTLALPAIAFAFSPLAAQSAAPAAAAEPGGITLDSQISVERVVAAADGSQTVSWKSPKDVTVVPGDKLRFTINYQNKSAEPVKDFSAVNPIPGPVEFTAATENWAEMSVDGGKNWGRLAALTVATAPADGAGGSRAATPADVTHVRWVFKDAIPGGGKGELSFYGVVK